MKKTTILVILLLICGFSLKAQSVYYPVSTKDVQECIHLMETPLGSELYYKAKDAKKWVSLKILNNPKMGGMYLVQLPNKSKQQLTVDSKGIMQLKNTATGKIRKFASKSIYLYRQDQTEYIENAYLGEGWSITSNGVTKKFKVVKEDYQNGIFDLTLEGLTGVFRLVDVANDIENVRSYELTSPDGSKKIYFLDAIKYE